MTLSLAFPESLSEDDHGNRCERLKGEPREWSCSTEGREKVRTGAHMRNEPERARPESSSGFAVAQGRKEPLLQLGLQFAGHMNEADTRAAVFIGPGDLALHVNGVANSGQGKAGAHRLADGSRL